MMTFAAKRAIAFLSYVARRPHKNGHGIHSPFLFDFATQVIYNNTALNPHLASIKSMRAQVLQSNETLHIEDFGAGSEKINHQQRKIAEIARYSSSSFKYSRLLYGTASYFQPRLTIELGSCLGLGTIPLALGSSQGKVYTIEGSQALFQKANEHYHQLGIKNIQSLLGNFDEVLPEVLRECGHFDLIFIDGNHRKDAVLRYFNTCLPYTRSNSMIIFDDIRWSKEMLAAWLEICRSEKVQLSLDLFHWGIIFFNEKLMKQHVEIFY